MRCGGRASGQQMSCGCRATGQQMRCRCRATGQQMRCGCRATGQQMRCGCRATATRRPAAVSGGQEYYAATAWRAGVQQSAQARCDYVEGRGQGLERRDGYIVSNERVSSRTLGSACARSGPSSCGVSSFAFFSRRKLSLPAARGERQGHAGPASGKGRASGRASAGESAVGRSVRASASR